MRCFFANLSLLLLTLMQIVTTTRTLFTYSNIIWCRSAGSVTITQRGTVGSYIGCYFFPLRKSACYSQRRHVMNMRFSVQAQLYVHGPRKPAPQQCGCYFPPSITWSTQRR